MKSKNKFKSFLKCYENKSLVPGSIQWNYAYHLYCIYNSFPLRNDYSMNNKYRDKNKKISARNSLHWHIKKIRLLKKDNPFLKDLY